MRLFIILLLLVSSIAQSQQRFGNEWINHQQVYFKIPIAETGIYRIDYQQLRRANFPVEKAPSGEIQLFHHGKEIAFFTNQKPNEVLKEGDFIEFYATRNDGKADSSLYRPTSAQPHQFHSLYSDTTYYYLTFSPNIQRAKRIQTSAIQNPNLKPETYHIAVEKQVFTDEFSFNSTTGPIPPLQQSYYERGETWTGKMLRKDLKYDYRIDLKNRFENSDSVRFEFQINGRSNDAREIKSSIENKNIESDLNGFDHKNLSLNLSNSSNIYTLTLTSAQERYSLNYWQISYPQKYVFEGGEKYFYPVQKADNQSLIKIQSPDKVQFFDITDESNPVNLSYQFSNGFIESVVPNTAQRRVLFLSDKIRQVADIQGFTFDKIEDKSSNFLIIMHPKLQNAAKEYAAYRASPIGGNFKVFVADINKIYEQFGYGEKHPLAVKRFIDLMQSNAKISYLLLLGKAHSVYTLRNDKTAIDLVPSLGYPASDALLSAGLNGFDEDVASIPTGRIPATTNEEVLIYLNKLKEHENQPITLNKKQILHLNGGKTFEEIQFFGDFLQGLESNIQNQFLGGQVKAFRKKTLEFVEPANVTDLINDGVSFISFLGHSSTTDTDFNIGFASPIENNYRNKGKYPVLFYHGCSFNNYFRETKTMSADWLFTPDKGAIAVVGQSYFGYTISLMPYIKKFYEIAFTNPQHYDKPLGELLQLAAQEDLKESVNIYANANAHQTLLFGDPSLRIFNLQRTDYQVVKSNLWIESLKGGSPITSSDSLKLTAVISNLGKYEKDKNLNLEVRNQLQGGELQTLKIQIKNVAFSDTIQVKFKNPKKLESINVRVDADNAIQEINEQNNEASLTLDQNIIAQSSYFPLSVLPDRINPIMTVLIDEKIPQNDNFVSSKPQVKVILQDENALISDKDTAKIEVAIRKVCDNCRYENIDLKKSNLKLQKADNQRIMFDFGINNLTEGSYQIRIQGYDLAKNASGNQPFTTTFKINKNTEKPIFIAYPNPAFECPVFELQNVDSYTSGTLQFNLFTEKGELIFSEESNVKSGTTSIKPYEKGLLKTGRYLYQAVFMNQIGEKVVFSGKVVVL
jgi:hypothetical protein